MKSKLCVKGCAFDWQLIVECCCSESWTFSQDVASLPSLRGSPEESSAFNFLFVLHLLRPHSPSLACDLCYSSCAVCAARSWKGRKTDLENYFTYIISARLCTLTAASRQKLTGAEGAGALPSRLGGWGTLCRTSPRSVPQFCFHARPSAARFLWRNRRKLHQPGPSAQKPQ